MRYVLPLGLALFAALPADAQKKSGQAVVSDWMGFCGTYTQLSSNAGECPTCTLLIADNPEIQMYFVESNNGWSAELTWVDGDESVATGEGAWGAVGGAHDGAPFDIDMANLDGILSMRLTHRDPTLGGTIEATFACTD